MYFDSDRTAADYGEPQQTSGMQVATRPHGYLYEAIAAAYEEGNSELAEALEADLVEEDPLAFAPRVYATYEPSERLEQMNLSRIEKRYE